MKTLLDDTQVPGRCYYYLLDFNEADNWTIIKEIEPDSNGKLHLLSRDTFWELFKRATEIDNQT